MAAKTLTVDLPAEIFDVQTNVPLIHQVVVAQLAAARQGTHATKTRGKVSGGGAKPYRQKGTGRARQGSTRAPQFAGGGTVFGPQPRDYEKKTPKKMKAAALRGALSDRAREGRVHVVSAFVDGDAPKTKAALATLDAVTQAKRVLVVLDRDDVLNWVSLRNLPQVHLIVDGYNVTKTGFPDLPLEAQRARLVNGLAALAAQSGAEVTCCFDGAEVGGRVSAPSARGVRVLFSQPGQTADELIRRLVRAEPAGRAVVVVSADREVADGVRRHGARPVAAMALVRRLDRA